MVLLRLFLSGLIAALFYGAWAWYANSLVTNDLIVLSKAALVQGSYSGIVTLMFTALLEWIYSQFGNKQVCLALIVPRWSKADRERPCSTQDNYQYAMDKQIARTREKACLPAALFTPLPALSVQIVLVVGVNWYFKTPNLWLTVAPSIVLNALYGYFYTFTLMRQSSRVRVTNS